MIDTLPATRKGAKAMGSLHFYTGRICSCGHDSKRLTSNGTCCVCALERSNKYYANNKGKRLEIRTKWASKYPGGLNEVARIYRKTVGGRISGMLRDARSRSKKTGIFCDLTRDWISARLKNGCELTGLPFRYSNDGRSKMDPFAPSIDKRDPSRGYTQENCRVVLWGINMAIADFGEGVYAQIAGAYLGRRFISGNSALT